MHDIWLFPFSLSIKLKINCFFFKGFVSLDDLLTVDILKSYSKSEIVTEVRKKTVNGKSRFELISREGKDLIRATFGRNFAPVSSTL